MLFLADLYDIAVCCNSMGENKLSFFFTWCISSSHVGLFNKKAKFFHNRSKFRPRIGERGEYCGMIEDTELLFAVGGEGDSGESEEAGGLGTVGVLGQHEHEHRTGPQAKAEADGFKFEGAPGGSKIARNYFYWKVLLS